MHNTKPASKASQLRGCTIFGASTSIATDTPILTISHNMKLTALAPGDTLERRLVMPRAIKAPGTTTVIAVVLCYVFGVMVWYEHTQLAVGLAIAATVLLHFKTELHGFSDRLAPGDVGRPLAVLLRLAAGDDDGGQAEGPHRREVPASALARDVLVAAAVHVGDPPVAQGRAVLDEQGHGGDVVGPDDVTRGQPARPADAHDPQPVGGPSQVGGCERGVDEQQRLAP